MFRFVSHTIYAIEKISIHKRHVNIEEQNLMIYEELLSDK